MAFGAAPSFRFPTAANAGSSQWGGDVRKLLDAPDASLNQVTICDFGTGLSAVDRTVDPYSTSTTFNSSIGDYGWAVTPSDMNSVSGARRFIPAGTYTMTARLKSSSAVASNVTLTMYLYRVGPASARTRTLLGSAGATVSVGNSYVTVQPNFALSELIFEPDETFQASFVMNSAGLAVTGKTVIFATGTESGIVVLVALPAQLGILASAPMTSAGTGAVSAAGAANVATAMTSAAAAVLTGRGAANAAGALTCAGTGVETAVGAANVASTFASSGAGAAAPAGAANVATRLTSAGSAVVSIVGAATFSSMLAAQGQGSAILVGSAFAAAAVQSAGAGAMSVVGSLVAGSALAAAGAGTPNWSPSAVLGGVLTVDIGGGGGGTTVIRKIIIYDKA